MAWCAEHECPADACGGPHWEGMRLSPEAIRIGELRLQLAQSAERENKLTTRVGELEGENAALRTPPDVAAWRSIVEYAYKIGGEGVRHVNSITGHYLAMRNRVAELEGKLDTSQRIYECNAKQISGFGAEVERHEQEMADIKADNARLREAMSEAYDLLDSLNSGVEWEGRSEVDPILAIMNAALSTAPAEAQGK